MRCYILYFGHFIKLLPKLGLAPHEIEIAAEPIEFETLSYDEGRASIYR